MTECHYHAPGYGSAVRSLYDEYDGDGNGCGTERGDSEDFRYGLQLGDGYGCGDSHKKSYTQGEKGDGSGAGYGSYLSGEGWGDGMHYHYGSREFEGDGYGSSFEKQFRKRVTAPPPQWRKRGLMPQRADGSILVWKNVVWDAKFNAWRGNLGFPHRVGGSYANSEVMVTAAEVKRLRAHNREQLRKQRGHGHCRADGSSAELRGVQG